MVQKLSVGLLALTVFFIPSIASAHVVVKPATVNVGEFTTFTVSVPNERDTAINEVKIDIPDGVQSVKPSVKNGWTVTPQKTGQGDNGKITAIIWTGGSIPSGLRDDFTFSAQAPEKKTTVIWKAYETYEDGTVVSWDQAADSESEEENRGPYSSTEVVNDIESDNAATVQNTSSSTTLPLVLSLLALTVSIGGVLFAKKR